MSAINAINLSRFFLKFIPQESDPDTWTQKNAPQRIPFKPIVLCFEIINNNWSVLSSSSKIILILIP